MKYIGFFTEMDTTLYDNGSIHEVIVDEITYDRKKIAAYLKSGRELAYGGKQAKDLLTGKIISDGFTLMSDGVFGWRSDLVYHIENYNIALPKDFILHVELQTHSSPSKPVKEQ